MTDDREWRAHLSHVFPKDLGPRIVRQYGGVSLRLWRRITVLALDLWLVMAIVRMVVGSRDRFVRDVGILLLVAAALVGLVVLGTVLAARRRRYDICRHGLVLRGQRGEQGVAVPWTTVDPGRIFVSTPPRHVHNWTPRGVLEWATRPTVVLINGWVRWPNNVEQSRTHRYDTGTSDYPFGWWQLGVTDPVALLAAIESAMVADGHPARGLTAAAISQRYDAGPTTLDVARELERGSVDSVVEMVHK